MHSDPSSTLDKFIVAGTSFCCSSAAFVLSAVVLLPLVASVMTAIGAPLILQQTTVLLTLFGMPIVAALIGINIGARAVLARHSETATSAAS